MAAGAADLTLPLDTWHSPMGGWWSRHTEQAQCEYQFDGEYIMTSETAVRPSHGYLLDWVMHGITSWATYNDTSWNKSGGERYFALHYRDMITISLELY